MAPHGAAIKPGGRAGRHDCCVTKAPIILGRLTGRKKVKSKLITLVGCLAAMAFCHAAIAAQDAPASASSAAAQATSGDRPASIDDDRPQAAPRYSAAMKSAGSGTVVLMVQVAADGKVKSVHVMMSSNTRSLDEEAVRTAKNWAYKPAIKNGVPVDGYVQVPITFNK